MLNKYLIIQGIHAQFLKITEPHGNMLTMMFESFRDVFLVT